MFVTVLHHIHDPEGFEAAEEKALEAGTPAGRCAARSMPPRPITPSASASGKANRSASVRDAGRGRVGAWAKNEYFEMHVDGLTPSL